MWLGLIFHNEELCYVYASVGVIGLAKCRRLRWAGYVANMGKQGKL